LAAFAKTLLREPVGKTSFFESLTSSLDFVFVVFVILLFGFQGASRNLSIARRAFPAQLYMPDAGLLLWQ
jgi:hypothetical protein